MAKRLDGRTAVITGAGQGIGRAIVHCFAREGSRVWATSRGLAPLQSLEKTASVRIEQLDVTRPTDVAAAAKKIGTVDILVNCAGYVASGTILDCSPEELERSLDVNLRGAFYDRAFLPGMCTRVPDRSSTSLRCYRVSPARPVDLPTVPPRLLLSDLPSLSPSISSPRESGLMPSPRCHPDAGAGIANCRQRRSQRHAGVFRRRHKMGRLGTVEEVAAACLLASAESAS